MESQYSIKSVIGKYVVKPLFLAGSLVVLGGLVGCGTPLDPNYGFQKEMDKTNPALYDKINGLNSSEIETIIKENDLVLEEPGLPAKFGKNLPVILKK